MKLKVTKIVYQCLNYKYDNNVLIIHEQNTAAAMKELFFFHRVIKVGGDYQLRSALAAKQIWVAVITI